MLNWITSSDTFYPVKVAEDILPWHYSYLCSNSVSFHLFCKLLSTHLHLTDSIAASHMLALTLSPYDHVVYAIFTTYCLRDYKNTLIACLLRMGRTGKRIKKGGFNYVCFVHLKIITVRSRKDNVIQLFCSWCHSKELLCRYVTASVVWFLTFHAFILKISLCAWPIRAHPFQMFALNPQWSTEVCKPALMAEFTRILIFSLISHYTLMPSGATVTGCNTACSTTGGNAEQPWTGGHDEWLSNLAVNIIMMRWVKRFFSLVPFIFLHR